MQVQEQFVDVRLLTDGVVVGGIARRAGTTVQVTSGARDQLILEGHARPLPLVEVHESNRLIGRRVCQPGDVVDALSVAQAKEMHVKGQVTWLNAAECNEQLPAQRQVDRRTAFDPSGRLPGS